MATDVSHPDTAAIWQEVWTQQSRADFLDVLYEQSGRTNNLYTGLYIEYMQRLDKGV